MRWTIGLQQLRRRFHRRRAANAAPTPLPPSLTSFQRWEECEKHKGKHKVFRFKFEPACCLFVCLLVCLQLRRRFIIAALPLLLTSFQRWEECEKHKVFRFRSEVSLFVCLFVGLSGLQQLRCCFHCRRHHHWRRSKDGKSVKSTSESIRFLGPGLKTAIMYHMAVCLFDSGFISFIIIFIFAATSACAPCRQCCWRCSKDGKSVKRTRESIRFLGSGMKPACMFVCLFEWVSGLQQLCCRFHCCCAAATIIDIVPKMGRVWKAQGKAWGY